MTTPHLPADLARQLDFAQRLLARTQEVQANLGELTGSAEVLDGFVKATVDCAGRPTGLTLAPRVLRRGSEELAEAILAAFGAAYDDLSRQSAELIAQEALPEQLRDPVGSGLVDDLAQHSRDITATLQSSSDPSTDALRLARDLQKRALRGI
jgi:DNA-binding protein YbaB